jgi:hypothetical protein
MQDDKFGARAWKGFDWDTMDRLYEKGFISDPVGEARSVGVTPEGRKLAEELFRSGKELRPLFVARRRRKRVAHRAVAAS